MKSVNEAMAGTIKDLRQNKRPNSGPPSDNPIAAAPTTEQECFRCHGAGWVYAVDHTGQAIFTLGRGPKMVRCICQYAGDQSRRSAHLLKIDGLQPHERELRFSGQIHNDALAGALETVEQAVAWRRGLITLTGRPGTGKTTLLCCAINEAREQGVPAVYTTMTDLLDYLRQAYSPNADVTFDSRWDLLVSCEVLALDELDEFNTTAWAMERFLRLIDERWRRMNDHLTLCATNRRINALPDKVASRLRDGRGQVIEIGGVDMRPYLEPATHYADDL